MFSQSKVEKLLDIEGRSVDGIHVGVQWTHQPEPESAPFTFDAVPNTGR
jgi:hypothetical protein